MLICYPYVDIWVKPTKEDFVEYMKNHGFTDTQIEFLFSEHWVDEDYVGDNDQTSEFYDFLKEKYEDKAVEQYNQEHLNEIKCFDELED